MEILGYILLIVGLLIAMFAGLMIIIKTLKNKKAQEGFIRQRVGYYPEWLTVGVIGAILCAFGDNILSNL